MSWSKHRIVYGEVLVRVQFRWCFSASLASGVSMSKLVCARGATVRGTGRTSLPFLFNVRLLALLLCAIV